MYKYASKHLLGPLNAMNTQTRAREVGCALVDSARRGGLSRAASFVFALIASLMFRLAPRRGAGTSWVVHALWRYWVSCV